MKLGFVFLVVALAACADHVRADGPFVASDEAADGLVGIYAVDRAPFDDLLYRISATDRTVTVDGAARPVMQVRMGAGEDEIVGAFDLLASRLPGTPGRFAAYVVPGTWVSFDYEADGPVPDAGQDGLVLLAEAAGDAVRVHLVKAALAEALLGVPPADVPGPDGDAVSVLPAVQARLLLANFADRIVAAETGFVLARVAPDDVAAREASASAYLAAQVEQHRVAVVARAEREAMAAAEAERAAKAFVPLPADPTGAHYVTPSGAVLAFAPASGGGHPMIVTALDAFWRDQGRAVGEAALLGTYAAANARLELAERLSLRPAARYRHCGPIYSYPSGSTLEPVLDREGVPVRGVWRARGDSDRFCRRPRTHVLACRVVSCDEWETVAPDGKDAYLVLDAVLAARMGEVARASYQGKSYAELLASSPERPATPGYFERGGACGDLSCDEEDTLRMIVEEYW